MGEMSITEAIGGGTVQVVKNHPSWPNPYNGITAIRHGDIDRDVGIYLAESEQRSCALAAGIKLKDVVSLCTTSGGYVVEQLPDCTPETIKIVEKNLEKLIVRDGTKVQRNDRSFLDFFHENQNFDAYNVVTLFIIIF